MQGMKHAHMQIYTPSKDFSSSKNNFSLHITLIFFTLVNFEFNNHYDALHNVPIAHDNWN